MKATSALFFCILVLIFVSVAESNVFSTEYLRKLNPNTRDAQSTAVSTASWIHGLTRRTLDGRTLSNPSLFSTPGQDYLSSLHTMGTVPIAIACGGSLIALVLFSILRFGLDKCGGKEPEDDYSMAEKWSVAISYIIFSVLILGMVAGVIVGHVFLLPLATDVTSTMQNQANIAKLASGRIDSSLTTINATATQAVPNVALIEGQGTLSLRTAENSSTELNNAESSRGIILIVCCAVIVLMVIFGIASLIFKIPNVALLAGFLGFAGIAAGSILVGVHFPVSVIISDMCNDVSTVGIQKIIQDRIADQGVVYSKSAMNGFIDCYNFADLEATIILADELIGNDTNPNPILVNTRKDIELLRTCNWMADSLVNFQNSASGCTSCLQGSILVWACGFTITVLCIPFTILSIIGYKRFRQFEERGFF